jgi:hypothetical protein
MMPNFIVIGAAKCGTTSMCDLLGMHPTVFMTDPKEPHFFSRENDESKPQAWYESLFAGAEGCSAVGEGSTSYTHPNVIDVAASRIASAIPDCRLIYMVRHPLKRLESDWRMRRHENWAPDCINEAVEKQRNLVRHGLYWKNLSVYRRFFPDEQILIVFLEDFSKDPDAELRRCFKHLRVNPSVIFPDARRARNRSQDLRRDGRIAAFLRKMSLFDCFKAGVPPWLLTAGKRTLTRREEFVVDWKPHIRLRVIEQFQADSQQFLQFCGRSADFWPWR